MNKRILSLIVLLGILMSCSIPQDLGLPSWITEFKVHLINDTYGASQIAEENENIISVEDTLRLNKVVYQSQELGTIEIVDTDERTISTTLGEFLPEEFHILHGQTEVIPPFDLIPVDKVMDDFEEFQQITFASGIFNLTITNNSSIWVGDALHENPMKIDIISNSTEDTLQTVIFDDPNLPDLGDIPPLGGSLTRSFDLSGKTYPTDVRLILHGGSRGTDGVASFIDTTSTINSAANLIDIEAEHVIGAIIEQQELDPISQIEEFDITHPEIIGDYELTGNSSIKFDIQTIKVPALIEVDIIGMNDDGQEVHLVRFDGDPVILNIPANQEELSIIYSSEVYNINELIAIIPDQFDVNLYPTIGDGSAVDTLSSTDSIKVDIEFNADFQLQNVTTDLWIIPKEDNELKVKSKNMEDYDSEIHDTFQSGSFQFEYLNPTGIELALDVIVSDSVSHIRDELINFSAPDTNKVQTFNIPLMENTINQNYKTFSLDLIQNDLEFFIADSIYWGTRIRLLSAGDDPWVGGVKLKGLLDLKLKVTENLMDDIGE